LVSQVTHGEVFAAIESVKAVSDVHSPISGEVMVINEDVEDSPELTNTDPYGAWLIRVKPSNLDDELAQLMNAEEYEQFCTK
jgi:glycine cleavage system H protein